MVTSSTHEAHMLRTVFALALGVYVLGALAWVLQAGVIRTTGTTEILNVACDPTRELWQDINTRFTTQYEAKTGTRLQIRQSHGGSGSQARAVLEGLEADILTLALWTDTDAVRKGKLIRDDWENRLPNQSLPFVSTIVFVVRAGNPKQITDWPDLARPGVQVITPNPKTSGNGKWSFLAMWGSVVRQGKSDAEARAFVEQVYAQVPVLDPAARAASSTFKDKKQGDVLLTWENEAHLDVQKSGGSLMIVYPPQSVLAEPHVALVDTVVDRKGTRAVAEAYLAFMYTQEAQRVMAQHYYRPTNTSIVPEAMAERFPPIALFNARTVLGGTWDDIQKRFFQNGGEFDQLSARLGAR
jgi:sulfate/thiosulfate transport system substrate-binding protein